MPASTSSGIRKSKINQAIMEREGLTPLPCFHLGEPIRYLEEMVERYQYIAVGGYVGLSMHHAAEFRRKYLSQIFAITRDRVAVHGFGVGSLSLLLRYPFFSTDATSWYRIARFGFLLTFKHGRLGKIRVKQEREKMIREGLPAACLDREGDLRYRERDIHNAKIYLQIEDFCTRVWAERGIRWDEPKLGPIR